MSTVTEPDPLAWRVATRATGLLRVFNDAGVLDAPDVHIAQRITALGKEPDETVGLAVALAVRALRGGSVCVDLRTVAEDADAPQLAWPEPGRWLSVLRASRLVAEQVLRLYDDRLLYLDRYWREEEQVCTDLLALSSPGTMGTDLPALQRLFPAERSGEQRAAAEIALSQAVTVLTGGPGTGKTTTIARLLAVLAEQAEASGSAGRTRPRIALAAPTGKAAARLTEAVAGQVAELDPVDQARLAGLQASTLHALLGWRRGSSVRFRHDRGNRLPHDVIVVDETSMVSLTLMARLLEAVRPDARLLLVGDPDQLASVEAGAVLADLVEGLAARRDTRVATLQTPHRYKESIGALAAAIRVGDADRVIALLDGGGEHVEWAAAENPAECLAAIVVPHALRVRQAALLGDAGEALRTLDEHRLLCAHRDGPHGARLWNRQARRWVSEQTGDPAWAQWYAGRPLLITANDYGLGVRNGDTGVVVVRNDGLRAVIATASAPVDYATSRLADVETMYAMTIHKSQGSEAREVTVLMPPVESRLLTRELFYTAVTRAKHKVRVVGSEAEIRAALDRRAVRASGLALRLREA